MKVLLVCPEYKRLFKEIKGAEWISPPLGLAYLSAVLKQNGHEVRIIDMQTDSTNPIDLVHDFDVLGITSTTPLINRALDILGKAKLTNPDILTVIGGAHASALPSEVSMEPPVDVVVYGEGEQTMKEICNKSELNSIKGIAFRSRINPPRELIRDLDELPFPDMSQFDLSKYSHPLRRSTSIPILTSRGCPYACVFCNKRIFGQHFRTRSPNNVVDEIEERVNTINVTEFHIIDDQFIQDRERTIEICKEIVRRKMDIQWCCPNGVRADSIDANLVRHMKKAGCYSLSFGVESGCPRILREINKQTTLKKIEDAVRVCKQQGIETVAFFVIGFPSETEKDIKMTIEFAKRIRPDFVDFHLMIPLPATEVYDYYKSNNLLLESDWSKFTFHDKPVFRNNHLSQRQLLLWYRKAYKSFYLDYKYLFSRLMKMKSISDIRNNIRGFLTVSK